MLKSLLTFLIERIAIPSPYHSIENVTDGAQPQLLQQITYQVFELFTSFKQFGEYAATNKANYELVKNFRVNELRDSLKDGTFFKKPDLIKLAKERFKGLAPLNPEIGLMVDPKAIFSAPSNSTFLNTLAFEHPEVYLTSLKEAYLNGFNRETFLGELTRELTQNNLVLNSIQHEFTLFAGKQTILFQNPKEFFENPNNGEYLIELASQFPKVYFRGLMDALSQQNFNPSNANNLAIWKASENGHTEIVKLLLKDERVDPAAKYNDPINYASKNGHTEIVQLLLKDERVNPTFSYNAAIREASRYGHTEIVKLLLKDERVDPSAYSNYAIEWASVNGHIEIFKLLLEDKRVDPTANCNYAIKNASYNGHTEIVKLLLKDERVDASTGRHFQFAIYGALCKGHIEIAKLLESKVPYLIK